MSKGFTLVEISIVLVIIGLLVGGILVGQNLIDSARVNRLVSDLRQYEIAINQFKSKFNSIAGDSPYFIPPGNNDRVLDRGANGVNNCAAAPNASLSNFESHQVWAHLSQASMINVNYPAASPSGELGIPNCSGPHGWQDLNAGRITPYTKIDPEASLDEDIGGTGFPDDKKTIQVRKEFANSNLYLRLILLPLDTLALENKMGVQASNGSQTLIGLVNPVGISKCYEVGTGMKDCGDPDADMGNLNFYMNP